MLRKLIIGFFILVSIQIISCSFDEPVMPSWNVLVRIPFFPERFVVGEKIVKNPNVITKNDSLFISIDGEIDPEEITAEDLSLEPEDRVENVYLDTLNLGNLAPIESGLIKLDTLLPGLDSLIGRTITIPETTISPHATVIEAEDFKRIHILNGDMRLMVTNRMPLILGPNSNSPDGLQISVINDSLNQTITTFNFADPISPGEEAQAVTRIENKWIYSPIRFEYQITTSKDTTIQVTQTLLDTAGFSIRLFLENIKADEAVVKLAPQVYNDIVKVGYDDENRLRQAVIDRGRIRLAFTNHLQLTSNVEFTIPAIRVPPNDPFTESFSFAPNATEIKEIVMDDYEIINPDNPGELIDSLAIIVNGSTEPSQDFVLATSNDSVTVDVDSDTIFLESFSGFLAEDSIEIEPFEESQVANYEGFDGDIEVADASLLLKITTDIVMENLSADLSITGFHKNQNGIRTDSAFLNLPNLEFNSPAQVGDSATTRFLLNNPEFVNFLNILPTSIRVDGIVRVSGDANIARGNRIGVGYLFETPMKANLNDTARFDGPDSILTKEKLDKEVQDASEEHLLNASMKFNLLNHTPIGGAVRVVVTTDMADTNLYDSQFDTSLGFIKEINFNAAPTDPQSGLVTGTNQREVEIGLTRREIQLFARPPVRYGYQFLLNPSDHFVFLRYSDFVEILGEVNIAVLIDDENN